MTLDATARAITSPAPSAEHQAKLARMAGQIAGFFGSYDEDEAVAAIADHINSFWSRRMRQDFVAAFAGGGGDLAPLARKALPKIKTATSGE